MDFGALLPIVIPEAHWETICNEETQHVVSQYPYRFAWFCNVDPRQGNFTAGANLGHIIGQYKQLGAKGLGELGTQLYADDPMMENLVTDGSLSMENYEKIMYKNAAELLDMKEFLS